MILSNEYIKKEKFGQIENLVYGKKKKKLFLKPYLAPIEKDLIDLKRLTTHERNYLSIIISKFTQKYRLF